MAFDFGSDIIVSAMNAADPTQAQLARLRLEEMARSTPAPIVTNTVGEFEKALQAKSHAPSQAEVFQKFESTVLTIFVQAMMPKESSAVFGEGLAGDIWKAQLAEKVADQMAQRGGIGIAASLLEDRSSAEAGGKSHEGLPNPAEALKDGRAADSASQLLYQIQLDAVRANDRLNDEQS